MVKSMEYPKAMLTNPRPVHIMDWTRNQTKTLSHMYPVNVPSLILDLELLVFIFHVRLNDGKRYTKI